METSVKSSKLKVRSVLTSVVAICALLAFSASADAEIGETVEAAAAAPVEAVEAPAPPAEPEPVQAVETAPVAEEIQPVHVPPPPKPVEAEAPSVTEPADVQELAQSVGKGSADSVAAVTKATKALAQGSLDAIGSAVDNALPGEQLPGIAVAPAAPSPDGSLSSPPPPQSDSLFPRPISGASPFPPPLVEFGGVEALAVGSGASGHPDGGAEARLSTAMEAGPVPFEATIGGGPIDRSGNPAPLNVPPPAPGSPGSIASGAGGSLFVPLAALLALLALAAPAILRRLREVPDFRPPIPFVCALERPG